MPHFSLVVPVSFGKVYECIRREGLHFTSAVVYLISRSANSIPELRRRIRSDRVVEHDVVHPSFSIQTGGTDVFSFCYVDYNSDFSVFTRSVHSAMREMAATPSFEDDPDRDDYLFLSAIPWVHFTSLTHPIQIRNVDSIPRITWGKLSSEEEGCKLPVGLQAHHGVVDGRHAGAFYQTLEDLCRNPEDAFRN